MITSSSSSQFQGEGEGGREGGTTYLRFDELLVLPLGSLERVFAG